MRTYGAFFEQIFALKKRAKMLSFIKFGPGGIRTHDQRIMSPLRYRCATGPWRYIKIIKFSKIMPVSSVRLRYLPLLKRYSIVFVGRVPQARGDFYLIFNVNGSARKPARLVLRQADTVSSTPPRRLTSARLALPLGANPLPTSPQTILNRSCR